MNDEETFQRLCAGQIEGTLTEPERAQLMELLRGSAEARRAYVTQMRIHAMLAWQHKPIPFALPENDAIEKIVRPSAWRWLNRAAAAMLLFFVSLAAWWQMSATRFEVVSAVGVSYRPGDHVKGRSIEIEGGELTFKLPSEAVVALTGPASLQLVDPMHVRLLRGRATVDVGKHAKGFIVDTATARVVDLGTRFGVAADAANATDVAVFEGKVEVYQPKPGKDQKPDAVLAAGDAVSVRKSQQPKRVKLIALGKDADSLDATRASDLVSNVTDNVADPIFRGYYSLARANMGEGAEVYTTGHTRTWHPLKGQTFPKELEDADVIRTFAVDRSVADLQITLQITHACDLYVMLDVRAPVSEWVRRDFVDTGYRLRSGPWIPRETPPEQAALLYQDDKAYHAFAVWKRRIAEASPVTLGSPFNPESPQDKPFMYGLAVKALR